MMWNPLLTLLPVLAVSIHAASLKSHSAVERQAAQGTATINLAAPLGTPSHLAAGFLYGIPDTANQVPDLFYTGMGFRYGRAGGSQLGAPARGWVYGATEFNNRFASALSNYKTCRKYGARMQILTADLWGADGTAQIAMPGDNGDWTSYDSFLTTLINSINNNKMTTGLDIEIWNEPDLTGVYWQRNQTQYLQMWGRGYARLRSAFPNNPIVGPCASSQPYAGNTWYQNYYSFIKTNNSIPDLYAWHLEGNPSDPNDDLQQNVPAQAALLSKYGLPTKPIIINEYAIKSEQQPGGSAWFISRLERYNVLGLRGNWASQGALHDYFAGLLGKPNAGTSSYSSTQAGYWGNGEYNVYRYYANNMTGQRMKTTGSPDNLFDIYATAGSTQSSVKMLCGSRLTAGTWDILVTNLSNVGMPTSGTVKIHAYQFNYAGGEFGNVHNPVDQGTYPHTYSNNELVFYVSPNQTTAYAFEFV